MKQGASGFLLIEVLLSLTLVALGFVAFAHTFTLTKSALQRGHVQRQLAECAQKKLFELSTQALFDPADGCDQFFSWTQETAPLSDNLERVSWVVRWTIKEDAYEERFDTVRSL